MSSLPPPGSVPPPPPPPPGAGGWDPTQPTSCWPVPPDYAGFGTRLGGAFIDGLIAAVPAFVLALLGAEVLGQLASLAITIGFTMMAGIKGQTPGMKAVDIRLLRADGTGPIGPGKAMARLVGSIISSIPLYLGFLWMLWDKPRRQTWHDKMVGAVVVRT